MVVCLPLREALERFACGPGGTLDRTAALTALSPEASSAGDAGALLLVSCTGEEAAREGWAPLFAALDAPEPFGGGAVRRLAVVCSGPGHGGSALAAAKQCVGHLLFSADGGYASHAQVLRACLDEACRAAGGEADWVAAGAPVHPDGALRLVRRLVRELPREWWDCPAAGPAGAALRRSWGPPPPSRTLTPQGIARDLLLAALCASRDHRPLAPACRRWPTGFSYNDLLPYLVRALSRVAPLTPAQEKQHAIPPVDAFERFRECTVQRPQLTDRLPDVRALTGRRAGCPPARKRKRGDLDLEERAAVAAGERVSRPLPAPAAPPAAVLDMRAPPRGKWFVRVDDPRDWAAPVGRHTRVHFCVDPSTVLAQLQRSGGGDFSVQHLQQRLLQERCLREC